MQYEPTPETTVLILTVSIWYLIFLAYRTINGRLDLYDLGMLSMAAILPAVFVLWPEFAVIVGKLTGVAFPFVVMFGALILVVFVFLHRISIKIHNLERLNRLLVQEVSLFKGEGTRRASDDA